MIISMLFGGLSMLMISAVWGILVYKLSCFLLKQTAKKKEV